MSYYPELTDNNGNPDGFIDDPAEALLHFVHQDDVIAFPLVILDHSGIIMRIGGSFAEDPGGWDTSRVGFIYVTHDKIKQEYGKVTRETIKRATAVLRAEVETYNDYLTGMAYEFLITKKHDPKCDDDECKHDEMVDDGYSCGFYPPAESKPPFRGKQRKPDYQEALDEARSRVKWLLSQESK